MFGFQTLIQRFGGLFMALTYLPTSLRGEAVAPRFFQSGRKGSDIIGKNAGNVKKCGEEGACRQ